MTGWKCTSEIMKFVEEIKEKFSQHPEFMPDAWYWLNMDLEELENKTRLTQSCWSDNDEYIAWLKKDEDGRLQRRINLLKEIKQIYFKQIEQINLKLKKLE